MKTQACEACAKRKVRCDRVEPICGNCRRRKRGDCIYPEASPYGRIRQLETIIRNLQAKDAGDKTQNENDGQSRFELSDQLKPEASTPGTNPTIVQSEGRQVYFQSEGWQKWSLSPGSADVNKTTDSSFSARSIHSPARPLPHAFGGSLWSMPLEKQNAPCPHSLMEALQLWDLYIDRVEWSQRFTFSWTLDEYRLALTNAEAWNHTSREDRALIIISCLFGAATLLDDEDFHYFGRRKAALEAEYREYAEICLSQLNILAIDSLTSVKALCLYIKASVDYVTVQSLWSLTGLLSRAAEQLGIHRDGYILGLSTIQTEERRRTWWQLQHLDLILAVKSGVTPMVFTADWDAKLPSNIEDCDLVQGSTTPVTPRKGLTTLSYTLLTYWVVERQRAFRLENFNQAKQIDRSLLGPLTDKLIDELEAGLNSQFIQYCDPVKSLHVVVAIIGRAIVCVLRLRRLHDVRVRTGSLDAASSRLYFELCSQLMQYIVTQNCQPNLRNFKWHANVMFAWHAFIGLLVDIPKLESITDFRAAWSLLSDLYEYATVVRLSEDRRTVHAASSVINTWKLCEETPRFAGISKPAFVMDLETKLMQHAMIDSRSVGVPRDVVSKEVDQQMPASDPWFNLNDGNGPFSFDFTDIDWTFWDAVN